MWALSIRQPWAWLIVGGHKNVENRQWSTSHRGPLLIHAAKGMTLTEYRLCHHYAAGRGVMLPTFDELLRGGIVGQVNLRNCFYMHDDYRRSLSSPWFEGPYGWHMIDAQPLPFFACRGQLRLFEVEMPYAGSR